MRPNTGALRLLPVRDPRVKINCVSFVFKSYTGQLNSISKPLLTCNQEGARFEKKIPFFRVSPQSLHAFLRQCSLVILPFEGSS